ncbi:tannase and feruloyl esterase-domain-containing protein [Podospora aff. communis PSN243]|uniref:Carboxylic ester hydrolase n=1 Tax=Podospora aff. communis PSN243 TaxID=3040156 RepID=A0AAV9GNQ7_9PEZI|nr:tannase and feruloyl esterase-domain-containing protein [Podospora aff. communis PSN243]
MASFKFSLLACGLLSLSLLGNALSVPAIARRQTNTPIAQLCRQETFATVLSELGGQHWPGSPYTSQTEPQRRDWPGQVLIYATGLDICGVRIDITANIAVEIFLPHPDKWNNRTLMVGNGAFAGQTNRVDMFSRALYGWTTMSTNTGHEWPITAGLGWAANNPELQKDWAWRAMSRSVPYAKRIVEVYYNTTTRDIPVKHYYSGCSTGGRQGIRQTEVDPNSFDGMLLGAPAWNVRSAMPVISRIGYISRTFGLDDLSETQLIQRLYNLTVEKCDTLPNTFDNAPDGIVSASDACLELFRNSDIRTGAVWEGLGCLNNDTPSDTCVTIAQRQGFLALLGADVFRNPSDNTPAGDGFDITSIKDISQNWLEADIRDWSSNQFSTYFLGRTIPWNSDANGTALLEASNAWDREVRANADGRVLNGNPNLRTILYTGTADGTVSSYGTDQLFSDAGGDGNANLAYFKIPGMPHCVDNGNGAVNPPWYIGQGGLAIVNATKWYMPNDTGLVDAAHDALIALTEWVENGRKPTQLIATAFVNATNNDWRIRYQRPVCASPRRQTYDGEGDVTDIGNWSCQ